MTTRHPSLALFVLALLALPGLAACALAQEGDARRTLRIEEGPLAKRWSRALAAIETSGETTWIGWSIDRGEQGLLMSDTGPDALGGGPRTRLTERLGAEPARAAERVAFLFAFPPGADGEAGIAGTRIRWRGRPRSGPSSDP